MKRFFINITNILVDNEIIVSNELKNHLFALRVKLYETIEIFNGNGIAYAAEVILINKKQVIIRVIGALKPTNNKHLIKYNIILAVAVVNLDKMDIIIQKSTELNVANIVPIITNRVQNPNKPHLNRKIPHWDNIINSSMEQCRRNLKPKLHSIIDFKQLLELSTTNDEMQCQYKFILTPPRQNNKQEEKQYKHMKYNTNSTNDDNLHNTLSTNQHNNKNILILIGPEGGFTNDELELALQHDFIATCLGNNVLRTETAAIAAITTIQVLYNNWYQT